MADKKKKTYSRPKDWEKTIKRSYWDKDKDYSGEKYEDNEKANEEKKRAKDAKKAGKGRFGKLFEKLIGGK
jgi:hypothetical protein